MSVFFQYFLEIMKIWVLETWENNTKTFLKPLYVWTSPGLCFPVLSLLEFSLSLFFSFSSLFLFFCFLSQSGLGLEFLPCRDKGGLILLIPVDRPLLEGFPPFIVPSPALKMLFCECRTVRLFSYLHYFSQFSVLSLALVLINDTQRKRWSALISVS